MKNKENKAKRIIKYYDPPTDTYMTREQLDMEYGELYDPAVNGGTSYVNKENPEGRVFVKGNTVYIIGRAVPPEEDDDDDTEEEEEEQAPEEEKEPEIGITISYYKLRELIDPFTVSYYNYDIFRNKNHHLHNTMKYAIVLFNREQYPYDIKSRFNYELQVKDYKEFFGSFFPMYMVKRTIYNAANLCDKCSFENFHLIIK